MSFELFYLLDSFQQVMYEQFFKKMNIVKKDDLSDMTILGLL